MKVTDKYKSIICSYLPEVVIMKKKNDIEELFKTLGIRKTDYPTAEEFAGNFKRCRLLRPHEIKQAKSTTLDPVKENI